MKEVLTSIEAHQRILRNFTLGYEVWISFVTDVEKVGAKDVEWTAQYGTRLLSYQRQDRKQRGHPTAVATSVRVLGAPHSRELILMATPLALAAHPSSHWQKQRWNQRPPECGDYFMVREPRTRRDYAWTWRLKQQELNKLSARMTTLVKAGNAAALRSELEVWTRVFIMHRGVRQQFARLLTSAQKLWHVCHHSQWPGIEPGALPFITKF